MAGLIYTFIFCLSALGVGYAITRKWIVALSRGEQIAISAVIGLGIFSMLVLFIGLAGALHFGLIILTIAYILGSLYGFKLFIADQAGKERYKFEPNHIVWIIVGLLFAFIGVIGVLSPVSSMEWDSVAYHLAVPKLYLQVNRIYPIDFIHHSNFPSSCDMLFLWGLKFGGQSAAKAFHWIYGLLMLLGVGGFAGRLTNKSSIGIAVTILAATPLILWESGTAYVDNAVGCCAALAVILAYEGYASKSWKFVILGGVITGFTLCVKLGSAPLVIALGLALVIFHIKSSVVDGLKKGFVLTALAVIICSPWLIKTYIYTGNPVYPFLYNVFGGRNWNDENARMYRMEQDSFGVGETAKDRKSLTAFIMLPWNLATSPAGYNTEGGSGFTNAGTPFAIIGAIYSVFLLALPFLPRHKSAGFLLFICGALFVMWFFMSQQTRYLMFILPVLTAVYACSYALSGKRLRIPLAIAVAAQGLFLLYVYGNYSALPSFSRLNLTSDEYLAEMGDDLTVANGMVNALPVGSKVLLIDEVRGFYFDRDYVWGNPGHHTLIPYESFNNSSELIAFLKTKGFTHIFFNERFATDIYENKSDTPKWRQLLKDAQKSDLEIVSDSPSYKMQMFLIKR